MIAREVALWKCYALDDFRRGIMRSKSFVRSEVTRSKSNGCLGFFIWNNTLLVAAVEGLIVDENCDEYTSEARNS